MANSANMNEEKKKALDAAIAKLEKDFGKGAVMRLGDSSAHVAVETVPTGCLSLDLALGLGGVPKGRVIEIYGPESSGKTTLALHCVAQAQKAGGEAAFIDVEHALDPVYAAQLGVDVASLLVAQPDSGEQALEIAETLVRMAAAALQRYPGLPVVFAGGVMSSELIRAYVAHRIPGACFVPGKYASDNAIGVSILAAREVCAWPNTSA